MCGVFEEMSNIEKAMVNYERCDAYMKIIQEKYDEQENSMYMNVKQQQQHNYQLDTPSITFDSYSMRYRPNTDLIFDNVSLRINPYEKIGVVGRSGSGKSSLINALLRIVEPLSGRILISNQDITNIPLKLLRQWFSIVPQDAFVFEGTLRDNLDPFHKHSDYELEQVLHELHFNDNNKMGCLSLDTKINEDGSIYSVGEKQLICFARAILQQRKIILFDEATANVDKKTQELMNKHIFTKFNNSTVIIIAHRLSNIMQCDKVIVMDKGEVIEYDKPQTLYMNNQSVFRQLCNNDKQMMI
jgi:ABC-type multidrug transport system fused ATPase/permease subunit